MSDFPTFSTIGDGYTHITPMSSEGMATTTTLSANVTWPSSNRAFYYPVRISRPVNLVKAFVCNGTAVAGNFDIGLYDIGGRRLVSTGSTAQSGTSTIQTVTISLTVAPGMYWLALVCSSTSARVYASTLSLPIAKAYGWRRENTALPLPATMTPVTYAGTNCFLFGVTARSVI